MSLFAEVYYFQNKKYASEFQDQDYVPDFGLSYLQERFKAKDLEKLYLRYEQRAQIGKKTL